MVMVAKAKARIGFTCIVCALEYRHRLIDIREAIAYSKGCIVDMFFGRSWSLN